VINLDKGQKISLDKDLGGIRKIILGVGWFPQGYTPRRFRKESASTQTSNTSQKKPGGFFNTVGDMFKGNARIGDVVNSAIDSGKGVINTISDNLDTSISSDALSALKDVDVDTSIMFISKGNVVETASFSNSKKWLLNNSVFHFGDNTTGKAEDMEGDKEQISIDFDKLPKEIDELIMFVNVYNAASKGQHFGNFGGGFARLSDQNKNELAFFNLNEKNDKQEGIYLLRMYTYNGEWKLEALGRPVRRASRYNDMVKDYKNQL